MEKVKNFVLLAMTKLKVLRNKEIILTEIEKNLELIEEKKVVFREKIKKYEDELEKLFAEINILIKQVANKLIELKKYE